MNSIQTENQIIHLECENELQIIIHGPDDKVWIKLLEGSAEIVGSDLLVNKEYEFSYFSSVGVFTWTSCTLNLRKETVNTDFRIVTSRQTPKLKCLYEQIERTHLGTGASSTDFPVILIAGPTDVGKSTLCRYLLNYAVKSGGEPIFIDLDVGQSSLSITGTLGILPIREQSDSNGKFNEQELCVYYFGYKSPGHNMTLYKHLLQKIGKSLEIRVNMSRSSGIVIDTCGWVDGGGYKLIREIINVLGVNLIVVLKQKSVYHKLMSDVSKKTKLIFVNKLKNVSTRNKTVRKDTRDNCVHQYFYGSYGQLKPFTIKVNFKELLIFKVDYSQSSNIISVVIEPSILYQVLALSYAENIEKLLLTSVYGFICIIELDMESEVAVVLSPQPGPLPTNYLIMGDITLMPKNFSDT